MSLCEEAIDFILMGGGASEIFASYSPEGYLQDQKIDSLILTARRPEVVNSKRRKFGAYSEALAICFRFSHQYVNSATFKIVVSFIVLSTVCQVQEFTTHN